MNDYSMQIQELQRQALKFAAAGNLETAKTIAEASVNLSQVIAERDEAISDLKFAGLCRQCKYHDYDSEEYPCNRCTTSKSEWKWRLEQ